MPLETKFSSFHDTLNKIKSEEEKYTSGLKLYDEAYEYVVEAIKPELNKVLESNLADSKLKSKALKKADLRTQKKQYYKLISKAVYNGQFSVEGYEDIDDFIEVMVEEIVGHSILSDAFADPEVDDIFCLGWDKIYVERNGHNEKYPKTFRNPKHYKDFIDRVLSTTGKSVNQGDHKIVDAEFYEDRIAVTDKSISPKDYSMTIRKHREDHLALQEIIQKGVMSEEISYLLGTIIKGEANMIYAGITGSGKTTTLRALLDHYVTETNKRMVVAEDTQELFPENDHTLELVKSPSKDPANNVDLRDLVITSLRLKPKYIVVGEVRDLEAEAAVEAMETGHATYSTMHGGTAWNIINRLVTKYLMQMPSLSIDVVERIIGSSLDYIAVQDAIPGIGRRVTSITEVTYDFLNRRVQLVPICEFDFETESFVQINKLSPEKANNMMRRGVPMKDIKDLIRDTEEDFCKSLKEFKSRQNFSKNIPNTLASSAKPGVIAGDDNEEEDTFW